MLFPDGHLEEEIVNKEHIDKENIICVWLVCASVNETYFFIFVDQFVVVWLSVFTCLQVQSMELQISNGP